MKLIKKDEEMAKNKKKVNRSVMFVLSIIQ